MAIILAINVAGLQANCLHFHMQIVLVLQTVYTTWHHVDIVLSIVWPLQRRSESFVASKACMLQKFCGERKKYWSK